MQDKQSMLSDDTIVLHDKFIRAARGGKLANVLKMLSEGLVHVDGLGTHSQGFQTALYTASMEGNLKVVQALLQAGADVNLSSWPNEETALHAACRSFSVKVVKALLDAGANVNTRNNSGETALILTLEWTKYNTKKGFARKLVIVRLLLIANCDVNVEANGKSALFYACEGKHL